MKVLIGLLLLWVEIPIGITAPIIKVEQLEFNANGQESRLTLHADGPLHYKSFNLSNPNRLVIDIKDAQLVATTKGLSFDGSFVRDIRSGSRDGNTLRIVLDLTEKVADRISFKAANDLAIDFGTGIKPTSAPISTAFPGSKMPLFQADPSGSMRTKNANLRDITIAIDPGHGGIDPGATGASGVHEKDVVLAIARKLAKLIRSEPGMQAIMTRDGDYFVPLRARVAKARERRADLFVSIHADAVANRQAKGSSVYVLSEHGASSEMARLLAQKENESDLIGGVRLDNKDRVLKSILLDLSQTGTIAASLTAGDAVLRCLCGVNNIHRQGVEQAGFMVLKAPDIPSMLVETAFISNPEEERKLVSNEFQQKIATAILNGIKKYFQQYAPLGTKLAAMTVHQHIVARGETLSTIADKYRVSVSKLRIVNNLSHDTLYVGSTLRIPSSSGT